MTDDSISKSPETKQELQQEPQQELQQEAPQESEDMQQYFDTLKQEVERCYVLADAARKNGYDPEKRVDIPLAKNMAERVEGLISAVAPELVGSGMTGEILHLEKKYGAGAWQVGLLIAEKVAKQEFCAFVDKKTAMEIGIRAGMAYTTAGIVAAPLEGFIELIIKKRRDGKEYFALGYAGPIRGAGGTAASVSVMIADYVRVKMGYAPYDPGPEEIKRFVTEINDYHERITNLQYRPSEEEIVFMVSHLPVEIDGDPTETLEVSNYKGLPRIPTNRIRGGMCLVVAEGLTQKSAKLWKRLQIWGKEFGLEWGFIEEFLVLQKRMKAKGKKEEIKDGKRTLTPNFTYIADLVAGRPVLSLPMRVGGLRLRLGRTRTSGFSAAAVHPSTQFVLDHYVATGTQLKVERPGKAAAITVCEALEGPIVRLKNGDVLQLNAVVEPKEILAQIDRVLFLGDILFNYGDFSENGHMLVPVGYCEEWYVQELKEALQKKYGSSLVQEQPVGGAGGAPGVASLIAQFVAETNIPADYLLHLFENLTTHRAELSHTLTLCNTLHLPLHPQFTHYWNAIPAEQLLHLLRWLQKGRMQYGAQDSVDKKIPSSASFLSLEKIIVPLQTQNDRNAKLVLEEIGLPHTVSIEHVIIAKPQAVALFLTLPLGDEVVLHKLIAELTLQLTNPVELNLRSPAPPPSLASPTSSASSPLTGSSHILDTINAYSFVSIRDKCGTFIGARMGRPEKAKMRKLDGSPQILFPVGDQGGRMRSFQSALEAGMIRSKFPTYICLVCNKETIYATCLLCNQETVKLYTCKQCGPRQKPVCPTHGPCMAFGEKEIPIAEYFQAALKKTGLTSYPDLIKGVRGTSNKDHIPENLVKGILRAKHDIYVNKDGTTRYDMSEIPITHFKPKEIGVSVEKIQALGYTIDIRGNPITSSDQVIEIKPQDFILPGSKDTLDEPASDVLFRVAGFIDDLLVALYGLEPFYKLKTKEDLVGQLVIGLAPHISAGTVGRIIGFSQTQGCYCHPLMHAAMRRDCDGDEACVMLLLDALLNFSRQFLPDARGSRTMDSPLVLSYKVIPTEVDDQAHGVDVVWEYPLELYRACAEYKNPWEVKIEQIRHRLKTPLQYEKMGFTHPVNNINVGVRVSSYKTLPSMEEKLRGQMELAERLRAVEESTVAQLVIEKHFLKDTKGNLRRFSKQEFRCVKCNEKFHRPPLVGKCTVCKGDLLFTVAEGSVIKYLGPSISLASKYHVPAYLQQTLLLTKTRIEEVFGKDKEKQTGLGAWFG